MSLTIVLTDEIRSLPYFSSFTEGQIEIPDKPFLQEMLDKTIDPEALSIKDLIQGIETCVYFALETGHLTRELFWKIGADEDTFNQWFIEEEGKTWSLRPGLPIVVEKELHALLGKRIDRVRLIKLGFRNINPTCIEICTEGNLRLLQWGYKLYPNEYLDHGPMVEVALNGHLECLKFLRGTECPLDKMAIDGAAQGGHLDCLKYLRAQGCPWDGWTILEAASHGHLDCLAYLHKNGCPWGELIMNDVAREGHLECLKYLWENGCPRHERTAWAAATGGHLECLKYLHRQGCILHPDAIMDTARYGHLDCLKYLHEQGCPLDEWATVKATRNGHIHCLEYLREHGCPEP